MRLRPLTEAECYARCYGGRSDDRVSLLNVGPDRAQGPEATGERLRRLFEGSAGELEPDQGLEAA